MFRFYLAALVVVVAVLATQSVAKEDGLEGLIKKVIAKLEKKDQAAEKQAFEKALETFKKLTNEIRGHFKSLKDWKDKGCNDVLYAIVEYTKLKIKDRLETNKADIMSKVQSLKRGGADDDSVKRSYFGRSDKIKSLFTELTKTVAVVLDTLGKMTKLQDAYRANQDATAEVGRLYNVIDKYKRAECNDITESTIKLYVDKT